jgi:DNA phosphorothioation system restriction enzyme
MTQVNLNRLMLRLEYRSDETRLARDLYERCLPESVQFNRAVGFFAGSVFGACPSVFHDFFARKGVMRVVCSPVLNRSDIEAMVAGYRDRPALVRKDRLAILQADQPALRRKSPELLSWLVASRRVEVRIAIRKSQRNVGLYHEKLGLFVDDNGDTIAFAGSANESLTALEHNFETVDIFRSWESDERRRVDQKAANFEALWNDDTGGLEVIPFPRAARLGLLIARSDSNEEHGLPISIERRVDDEEFGPVPLLEETLAIPTGLRLRDHQKLALKSWFDNGGKGIFEMATGSGKTIAALALAAKMYESIGAPLAVVIVCPYLHLASQWEEVAETFGLEPLICAFSRERWYEALSTRLYNLMSDKRPLLSVIVTNKTFADELFQSLLKRFPPRSLIIADEVHNLGAKNLRHTLPEHIPYRIGLSATWKREHDQEGTDAIQAYFDRPVETYSLKEALDDDVLCPYSYYPILVELADHEFDEYVDLTQQIGKLVHSEGSFEESPRLQTLLIQRARLLATAEQKIPRLIGLLSSLKTTTHNLIYCGDGSVESELDAGLERQIDAVTRVIGRDIEMSVAKYVADTPLTTRHELRDRFAKGKTQCLVAIRCLDEGVDIPETRRAFILASSTNPRQFIQRRGRILRRAPGKDLAEVYDFIVEPPADTLEPGSPCYEITRRLFRRELNRITEFANLAVNGPEAMNMLLPLRDSLGLLDFDQGDDDV